MFNLSGYIRILGKKIHRSNLFLEYYHPQLLYIIKYREYSSLSIFIFLFYNGMYFIKIKIQKCLNFNFFFPQYIFFINSAIQFSNIN